MNSFFQGVEENPDAAAGRLMQRAHNRDGLPEIAIGVVLLLWAGLLWLPEVLQPRSPWNLVSPLGMMLIVAPLSGASPWVIKKVRRRFLIERVGYVEMKPANRKRLATVLGLSFVVAVAVGYAGSRGAFPPASWVLAATGIFGGALAAYAGRTPRFVIGGVVGAVLGCLAGLNRLPLATGFAMLYGIMGLLSLISGCVVLLLFIRRQDEAGE